MSPLRTRSKEPDSVCADAEARELARQAAVELAGEDRAGDYLGAEAEGERVVTHLFACLDPAYQGWRWAVTVCRASRSKTVTISESLLLPGPDAVLAPPWLPWRERLRPGDLGVGDILPAAADDERLVPVAALEGDDGIGDWGEASWAAAGLKTPSTAELAAPEDEGGLEEGVFGAEGAAGEGAAGEGASGEVAQEAAHAPGAEGTAGQGGAAGVAGRGGQPGAGGGVRGRAAGQGGRRRRSRRSAAGEPAAGWDTAPGRARVLSAIGRDEAAFRWYTSEHGPQSPLANAAPGPCLSCGFFVHLAGPLGQVFGVCANEYAPDDGRVVSVDHGCGAHSEGPLVPGMESPVSPVIDELGYDLVDVQGVSVDDTDFEPID